MFLNLNKRKNRRNIKKIYINWGTYKNINQDDKNHYIAFINYLKDLNNNPDFEKWFFKYANNNDSIIRGCSLNLIKNNHRLY